MSTLNSEHHDYWNSFYASPRGKSVAKEASPFAHWVRDCLRDNQTVVEFGFGTGRDSVWFAQQGYRVLAYDLAKAAVDMASERKSGGSMRVPAFRVLDLADPEATTVVGEDIRGTEVAPALYARFLLHSLTAMARENFLRLAARVLAEGGELYLEFRTQEDRVTKHVFGEDHFRVYLDADTVVAEIELLGGKVSQCETGRGMARYKDEDPHVARIVARWAS